MAPLVLASIDPGRLGVDIGSFLVVVVTGATAGTIATLVESRRWLVPSVVLELVLGIIVGPHVLRIGHVNDFTQLFADLGLGMLFFFAGYEIDLRRISGRPLRLAGYGWAASLVIAYAAAGILTAVGLVVSPVYTGSALATTAIGTLIPILADARELQTRFGTFLLAAGAVGEFGPILLLTLILTTQSPIHEALLLLAFVALAVAVAVLAVRSAPRTLPIFERTIEASSQLAVRWIVVLVFALLMVAADLGLDLLLGGFAAGLITREVLRGHEIELFDSKIKAVGFGFFIPFFFVWSGMNLALGAMFGSPSGVVKLFVFLALFLVVRGAPALLLYRRVLDARERRALALFTSTQLPLVLAITTVALATHHMRPSTAAALVSAAVLSTLIYPLLGLRLRRPPEAAAAAAATP